LNSWPLFLDFWRLWAVSSMRGAYLNHPYLHNLHTMITRHYTHHPLLVTRIFRIHCNNGLYGCTGRHLCLNLSCVANAPSLASEAWQILQKVRSSPPTNLSPTIEG
jgi:hypothetical protein